MAGIGFELRRMLHGDGGIASRLQALLTATLITAGPWIVTMCTLLLVSVLGRSNLDEATDSAFRTLVTYAFAVSMVTVGAVQMPMTRHLADLLHGREYDRVLPAFVGASLGVGGFQALTAFAFVWCAGFDNLTGAVFVALYVAVSLNWLAMAWLTVIRQHVPILAAFLLGLTCSILVVKQTGAEDGLAGPLFAYAAGQGLTFLLLAMLIMRGLEPGNTRSFGVFRAVTRYPLLLLTGICYSTGVWIDKFVFWFADGITTAPLLKSHPLYDTSCFLAYLTVIPALALNLIVLETRFYERYRTYYAALVKGLPLRDVEWQRGEMIESLREGAILLLRWQGLFTGLAIVFAPVVLEALGMPEGMVRTFRLACAGAFFQVFLLIAVLVLLYFDLRREAVESTLCFLVLNGVLAGVSLALGYPVYGAGYAAAGFCSLAWAWFRLQRALPRLEYSCLTRSAFGG